MQPMINQCNSLALLRLSALGDVVMWVPVIRSLQKQYPDLKITWITSKQAYAILKDLSGVEFVVIDKPTCLADYWRFYKMMQSRYFDVLFCGQANLRCNFLYPLIKAKTKIGFDKQRGRDLHSLFINQEIPFKKEHLMESFFAFAKLIGVKSPSWVWDLVIEKSDYEFAQQQLPADIRYLALNPMASKVERNWPYERYVELANRLQQQQDVTIVLTGGPSAKEKELADKISCNLIKPAINLVGKTTPKQLAAILARATCLIAPDTGPAHIAVAMGTPVVGLYAVAPSQLSGPYFSQDLVIDKYETAVREILKKNPEDLKWVTRVHSEEAMKLISIDEVLTKVNKVLTNESH